MAILLKHAQEAAEDADGARVLVDRARPRGRREAMLALRAWFAVLAPSVELQTWFEERPRQWPIFRRRYLAELANEAALDALTKLETICTESATATLVTSAAPLERSHAAILRDLLSGVRKPPASTGPLRAAAGKRVRARRKF